MPTKRDCEICRGSGLVRLPVHRRISVLSGPSSQIAEVAEANWRDFPCPECGDAIPLERLAVVEFHTRFDTRIGDLDADFIRHIKDHTAHCLIGELLKRRLIAFYRLPENKDDQTATVQATIGVVSPTQVALLDERIRQRQDIVAQQVVEEAVKQIANWGSDYSGNQGPMRKSQAIEYVRRALSDILAQKPPRPDDR